MNLGHRGANYTVRPPLAVLGPAVLDTSLSAQEVARRVGMTITGVLWACAFYGIHRPTRPLPVATLRHLSLTEHRSDSEIALLYGYGKRAVTNMRARHGVGLKQWSRRRRIALPPGEAAWHVQEKPVRPLFDEAFIAEAYRSQKYDNDPRAMRAEAAWRGVMPAFHSGCGNGTARCSEW